MGTTNTVLPNALIPADSQGGDTPRRSSLLFLRLLETHQPRFQGAECHLNAVGSTWTVCRRYRIYHRSAESVRTEGHRKAAVGENNADARIWWAVPRQVPAREASLCSGVIATPQTYVGETKSSVQCHTSRRPLQDYGVNHSDCCMPARVTPHQTAGCPQLRS